ncbi:hypothetical protein DRW41_02505 [Neobacillus piezotolerans]|uniref:DUF4131 domain-containing protein n=1 Tax=Neobacillus piezotolerans TaxID=2259171 RepID=A0A3D8GVJ5_9BACI|nr:hypothetical protein [Neobacillus piezotolerans]RDU38455.1 hypothetical protein DRW41_02505 [Neobacillus piezotolerans]
MVTAILIPIICFYFLWLTLKEAKENEKKWLQTATAEEEAIVFGEVLSVIEEKQRFYYHRYIFVQELAVRTEGRQVKAKIITPLTKGVAIKGYHAGQTVRIYGCWEKNWFHANRVEIVEKS